MTFSEWVLWEDRPSERSPGVYLLPHFDTPPSGPADPQTQEIVYIGETCRRLVGRWSDFDGAAFQGKGGHSGGTTYREKFGDACKKKLYVAAFPVDHLDKDIRPMFIRYVERKLIWEYTQTFERLPTCNRK